MSARKNRLALARATRPSVVYMARHKITGERYIGYTSRPFARRKSDHLKGAVNGWSPGLFAEAIKLYGPDTFEWFILAQFDSSKEALDEEQRLIRELHPEYNRTSGGGAYKPLVHSEEVIAKLRDLAIKNAENWKKFSALGPAKVSKRVVCLNDGRVFESAAAAGREYGIAGNFIVQICNRLPSRYMAKGLVFRFEGDHLDADAQITKAKEAIEAGRRQTQIANDRKRKAVICIDDGNLFPGALEAAQFYGIPHLRYDIGDVCRGKRSKRGKTRRTVAGRRFRYVDEINEQTPIS